MPGQMCRAPPQAKCSTVSCWPRSYFQSPLALPLLAEDTASLICWHADESRTDFDGNNFFFFMSQSRPGRLADAKRACVAKKSGVWFLACESWIKVLSNSFCFCALNLLPDLWGRWADGKPLCNSSSIPSSEYTLEAWIVLVWCSFFLLLQSRWLVISSNCPKVWNFTQAHSYSNRMGGKCVKKDPSPLPLYAKKLIHLHW